MPSAHRTLFANLLQTPPEIPKPASSSGIEWESFNLVGLKKGPAELFLENRR